MAKSSMCASLSKNMSCSSVHGICCISHLQHVLTSACLQAKRLQNLFRAHAEQRKKQQTENSGVEEERKQNEQQEVEDEIRKSIRSLNAQFYSSYSLWDSSDDEDDSDEDLWSSSDEEEDSDEEAEDSDEETDDSDDEAEDSDEEADDSKSSKEEEEGCLEAEDSDEEAEQRISEVHEGDQVIGGTGDFATLTVCSPSIHCSLHILLQHSTVLEYVWHCCQKLPLGCLSSCF